MFRNEGADERRNQIQAETEMEYLSFHQCRQQRNRHEQYDVSKTHETYPFELLHRFSLFLPISRIRGLYAASGSHGSRG